MRQTFSCIGTEYSLCLYMMLNRNWRTTIFFPPDRIDSKIVKKLNKEGVNFFGGYRLTRFMHLNIGMNFILRVFYKVACNFINMYLLIKLERFFKREKSADWDVYGHEHIFPALMFLHHKWRFHVIEDGFATHMEKEKAIDVWERFYWLKWHPDILPGGWSELVTDIYASDVLPTPVGLSDKMKSCNFLEVWEKLPEDEKKSLTYIFGFDYVEWKMLLESGHDYILLTQNLLPEKELIAVYEKILKKYDKSRIIIKAHPSDDICYEKYFPECIVRRDRFPFELLKWSGLHLKKVISINSTASFGWDNKKSDLYPEYAKKNKKIFSRITFMQPECMKDLMKYYFYRLIEIVNK